MFNPRVFENSLPGGCAVLQVVESARAEKDAAQRFVPLKQTMLRGDVGGPLATLEFKQTFGYARAESTAVLEALYRFPLPGDAAVTGVVVRFGDTMIETRLVERNQAETEYELAKEAGQQAALLSREAPDVFTLQVAGIQPDEDISITTSYVQLARLDEGAWTLRVPLTTAPRFVRTDELGSAHANGQPLRVLHDPGHRFSLDVYFSDVGEVVSLTHELLVEAEDADAHVSLAAGSVLPDRDCVLSWRARQVEVRPTFSVAAHRDGDDGLYFLGLLAPPALPVDEPPVPREVLLLVDHSGSMSGPKWAAADWAVERFLNDLRPNDAFALCCFHTETHWYRRELALATPDEICAAVTWLGRYRDSGGTNLGVALEEALSLPPADGTRTRTVLVITDAQVTDDGRILRLVDSEAAKADGGRRVSVLCIDAAPNSYLAQQVAERGGGIARFLTSSPSEGDITTALDRVLAAWSEAVLANVRLSAGQMAIEPSGQRLVANQDGTWAVDLGNLSASQPLWTAGRISNLSEEMLSLHVETANGQSVAQATIDLSEPHHRPQLKALFGARRINALEHLIHADYDRETLAAQLQQLGFSIDDLLTLSTDQVYAESRRQATEVALQRLLVREALEYGLPSSVTSFFAVRNEAGEKVDQRVIVANALPAGWSNAFSEDIPAFRARRASPVSTGGILPGMGSDVLPVAAGMPISALPTEPAMAQPSTSPMGRPTAATWTTIFDGILATAGSSVTLYDSETAQTQLATPATIHGIRLEDTKVTEGLTSIDRAITISIYIGDLAAPRAKVRLGDLARFGDRPLNLRRVKGDRVLIVLDDPNDSLAGRTESLTIAIRW